MNDSSQSPQSEESSISSSPEESLHNEHPLNLEQMFVLIDSILPFEACLYYQVIPLSIESTHLNLGMVDIHDAVATEYVRRQVAYIKYSVVTLKISSDWHREMLSKYLSYAAKTKQMRVVTPPVDTLPPAQSLPPASQPSISPDHGLSSDQNLEFQTFVVDSPEHLSDWAIPPSRLPPLDTIVDQVPAAKQPETAPIPDDVVLPPNARPVQPPLEPLALNLTEQDTRRTLTELRHLSPPDLMKFLLCRVLDEGIGRLYFERRQDNGRILWSKDGVVQSVLNGLSLDLLQSVINEFKLLTHLPLIPIQSSRQVEIERLYNHDRVLIRFRLIKGSYGEEATLQVLRGAALKFYQQQQIDQLGRDALNMAQDLQKRIIEIRDKGRETLSSQLKTSSDDTLAAISQLLQDIEAQIKTILSPSESDQT